MNKKRKRRRRKPSPPPSNAQSILIAFGILLGLAILSLVFIVVWDWLGGKLYPPVKFINRTRRI